MKCNMITLYKQPLCWLKKKKKKKFRNERYQIPEFSGKDAGQNHNSESSFINSPLDIRNVVEVNFDKAVLMMTTN